MNSEIESLRSMIDSCFTYGGADRDSYNFERYIKPHENELGIKMFNKVYEERLKDLKENYEIEHCVYTDHEGCTYNSLKRKV